MQSRSGAERDKGRRGIDRASLAGSASERARRIQLAAAAAGMAIGGRLKKIEGEHMFDRWRWGRVPMEGGGWLVTFTHDPRAEWDDIRGGMGGKEVRCAVMQSQFGWVYTQCVSIRPKRG